MIILVVLNGFGQQKTKPIKANFNVQTTPKEVEKKLDYDL